MKKLLLIVSMIAILSTLVACQTQDAFSVFERAASSEIVLVDQYEAIATTDLNDQSLDELSSDGMQILSVTMNDDDLSNLEKITYIRSLYRDIQIAHAQNILIKYEIQDIWVVLKDNVATFRENELVLTEEDQMTLQDYKLEFSLRRLEVQASIGSIKTSLEQLKGLYDIDHLDLIIDHFESILDVLNMRYDHMVYLKLALEDVNTIAVSYLD
ncbi:MAG: hypothetical protein KKH01_03745 [Firmicutes bacterium]|nr:hypothetical protein [Bacillota bacterium]